MKCPYCGSEDTQVKDSRPTDDKAAIRRRRICDKCEGRFTTFERIQLRDLVVVKNSGEKQPFDREKLFRSLKLALQKRPVESERVHLVVNDIVRQLETLGESEIPTKLIGEKAMEALAALDPVAYVRYASVYKDFREVSDFRDFVGELKEKAG